MHVTRHPNVKQSCNAMLAMMEIQQYFISFEFQPYDQMDFSQVRCQSILMSAIERARRQNLLNQDLFLQPN